MNNYEILENGEYYVFSKQEREKIQLGYLYTTRCSSPSEPYMIFCSVEVGQPLPLVRSGKSQYDRGQIKSFNFDSRNLLLIDEVSNCAMNWLNKMQRELKEPQFDESAGCTIAVIQVNQGILSAFYEKEEFLNAFFETFDLFNTYEVKKSMSNLEDFSEP